MAISVEVANVVSAFAAFGAAIFWFWSAAAKTPAPGAYYGYTPEHDPFLMAFRASMKRNCIAAALAGLSALAMTVATVLQALPK
jgi:hypothetical protein